MTSIYEKKNLGRSAAYSCRANVLYDFIILRKKQWTQMKTKQLKQDILNHQESMGFPRLNAATETRTNLTFYGRRVEDS